MAQILRKSVLFITYDGLLAGMPVVSAGCPSRSHEILRDSQFGRLVPLGNAAELADAMAASLAATHDIAALKAQAQEFSIDKATDRYLELLFPQTSSGAST